MYIYREREKKLSQYSACTRDRLKFILLNLLLQAFIVVHVFTDGYCGERNKWMFKFKYNSMKYFCTSLREQNIFPRDLFL